MTAGTGITLSGSTGAVTVTNASPNATHTGDATGATALTVVGLQGRSVSSTAPTDGQILKWNNATTTWVPSADNNSTYTAGTGLTLTGSTFSHNAHTGDATGSTALPL
jgi:hypothetical protein